MWHIYILECQNHSLYTGITNNLVKRLRSHKDGCGAKYTRAFGVLGIRYCESARTKAKALKREAEIKKMSRAEKLMLISCKAEFRKNK